MKTFCDLHTHSTFSDGTESPAQLIQRAEQIGLGALALTDHNTIAGLKEFLAAPVHSDLKRICGVELSTDYCGRELHLVGLFLEPGIFGQLNDFLQQSNAQKEQSNRRLINQLNCAGYPLNYDALRAAHRGSINRAVIAAELLRMGAVNSIREALRGLLSEQYGFYHPPKRIAALDAIRVLRDLRAVPVLAHPLISLTPPETGRFLQAAKPLGLAAIETRYASNTVWDTARSVALAKNHRLLESGGSDYHGANKPEIRLGTGTGNLCVPLSFAQNLAALHQNIC